MWILCTCVHVITTGYYVWSDFSRWIFGAIYSPEKKSRSCHQNIMDSSEQAVSTWKYCFFGNNIVLCSWKGNTVQIKWSVHWILICFFIFIWISFTVTTFEHNTKGSILLVKLCCDFSVTKYWASTCASLLRSKTNMKENNKNHSWIKMFFSSTGVSNSNSGNIELERRLREVAPTPSTFGELRQWMVETQQSRRDFIVQDPKPDITTILKRYPRLQDMNVAVSKTFSSLSCVCIWILIIVIATMGL